MSLIDYLYVDDKRLGAYIEQIGPPVTYDKVPVWKAEFGLTGPKAATSQERPGRAMTRHEMIVKLLRHLEENNLMDTTREPARHLWDGTDRNDFVYETCAASKVIIPPKPDAQLRGLVLWISSAPPLRTRTPDNKLPEKVSGSCLRPGMLCLFEDFQKGDESPYSGFHVSAYTVLESIILAIGENTQTPIVSDLFVKRGQRHRQTHRLEVWDQAALYMEEFVKDPVAMLENAGCRAARPRNIRVLYRIREFGPEAGEYEQSVSRGVNPSTSVFGYPIFIAAER